MESRIGLLQRKEPTLCVRVWTQNEREESRESLSGRDLLEEVAHTTGEAGLKSAGWAGGLEPPGKTSCCSPESEGRLEAELPLPRGTVVLRPTLTDITGVIHFNVC